MRTNARESGHSFCARFVGEPQAASVKPKLLYLKYGRQAGSSILSFQRADEQGVRSLVEGVAHLVRELLVF